MSQSAVPDDLAQAQDGDAAAFDRLVAPLRHELRAHCYRMLGSIHDADDALQDALLRAWRSLDQFEGRSSIRSWLYTVATRTCLDTISGRSRRALPVDLGPASTHTVVHDAPSSEVAWLAPFPDADLAYEQRESVELAFVSALQYLPGNQRAALLLFEVLGFSVAEIAALMDTSTASVNSALQRARAIVSEKIPAASQQTTLRRIGDSQVQKIVTAYAKALQRGDTAALVALLTDDVTWSMPPMPHWYRGLDAVTDFAVRVPLNDCGQWLFRLVSANGQPAVAFYLDPDESGEHAGWSITVLSLRENPDGPGGHITELTSFIGEEHFAAFGLPVTLSGDYP